MAAYYYRPFVLGPTAALLRGLIELHVTGSDESPAAALRQFAKSLEDGGADRWDPSDPTEVPLIHYPDPDDGLPGLEQQPEDL